MRISLFLLSFIFISQTFAQTAADIKKDADWIWEDEQIFRKELEKDGIPAAAIDKLVASRKQLIFSGRTVSSIKHPGNLRDKKDPIPFATCSDMGVENGWGSWVARTGVFAGMTPIPWSGPLAAPVAPRFNITSGTGTDACTPGPSPGSPTIPVVAPGFGNASIQLGQLQTNGAAGGCGSGCAEHLTYPLTVTAQDTDMTFSYAMVIEDPSHSPGDQPFVSLCIMDQNGDTVPCGYFKYIAGPGIPGIYQSACNINSVSYYKPWTTHGIKLANYVGQTLTIEIINADCSLSGHFAHSYWDFSCGPMEIAYCTGQIDSLCAPSDTAAPYNYQWFHNGTIVPGGTSTCMTITPQAFDTFSVHVMPPSGCLFELTYYLTDTCLMFSVNASSTPDSCSTNTGTATASAQNGTAPFTYNWLPGGQTTQTITGLSAGSYTVTVLDSLNQSGVSIVQVLSAVIAGAATSTPETCPGSANGTASANTSGGTLPLTYLWNNGQTTFTATGLSAGNYSVSVTDAIGCSISLAVSVGYSMTAATSTTPVSCFGGSNGTATVNVGGGNAPYTYLWSSGQSTNAASNLAAGSYSVTVTDAIGCSYALTVQITGPASAFNANVNYNPATCWNCPDGDAAVSSVSGGSPPYSYLWLTSPVQTTQNIANLLPGSYQVIVTDGKGCTDTETAYVLFLGVNEILNESVSISPNPSSGNFTIDFGGKNFGKSEISLYSLVGEKILEAKIKAYGKQEFDASVVPAGIYFLKLRTEQGTTTKKIVIAR